MEMSEKAIKSNNWTRISYLTKVICIGFAFALRVLAMSVFADDDMSDRPNIIFILLDLDIPTLVATVGRL